MMLTTLGGWLWDANLLVVVPLGLAWVLSHALAWQRASVRHHLWAVSLAIALFSPAATLVLPRVDVRVLQTSPRVMAALFRVDQSLSEMTGRRVRSVPITREPERARWTMSPGIAIWLAGASGLLGLRLRRRHRLASLCAKARPWDGPGRIAVHEEVIVPMLAGLRRPTVLLPAAATDWPPHELHAILVHERAHLRRRDHIIALMSDIATIVYWLNLLVWVAAMSLDRERERACDDEVLQAGVKPSVYAAALLHIAHDVPRPARIAGARTMAGGGFHARVQRLLAHRPPRSGSVPLSWPSTVALMSLGTIAVASVHVVGSAPVLQPGEVLAVVNGEPLTTTEFEDRRQAARRSRSEADALLPQLLVEAVDDLVVVQRGKELGYNLSDAQFTSAIENIKTENGLQSDEEFQAALMREHVTLAELRRRFERQMIVSRLRLSERSNQVGVTEEDARQYYAAHADEFSRVPFDQVRDQINERVTAINGQRTWEAFLQARRSQAIIDWKTSGAKRAFEEGLSQRANAQR
jgi:beta-lactamase regulating signal transducer with metallopeptidase domain